MEKRVENFIESRYRDIIDKNYEFQELYENAKSEKLKIIFSTYHYKINTLFKSMNQRLPTRETEAHFWAGDSRGLIELIEDILELQKVLSDSIYAFDIDPYYMKVFDWSMSFLGQYGGSKIPVNSAKIEIIYVEPIFSMKDTIQKTIETVSINYTLKFIGEGSYAQVFKYKDTFYNKYFVVKRAKKDLDPKEVDRFWREYDTMKSLSSPYIVEVYSYNRDNNEYIMEKMDESLESYINNNNNKLTHSQRKNICAQIFKAFEYIHSKELLHRDISPKNILLKHYDDISVVKISDFGLVKIPKSSYTSITTEFKGYFNDPVLMTEGFYNYSMKHEIYALTKVIYFVMTGRTNTNRIENANIEKFVLKGMNPNPNYRYKSVSEMRDALKDL